MADQRLPIAPPVITQALRPQIAVYASPDVDELAKANGLANLAQLLKPWEGSVERVTLRTSTFSSQVVPALPLLIDDSRDLVHTELDALFLDDLTVSVERRTAEWLKGMDVLDVGEGGDEALWKDGTVEELTPWYSYYRQALVNRRPRTEYETFGHPVAAFIAVSTSNAEPLNAFAELYDQTLPEKLFADKPWVDPNILRYYVLIHDLSTGPAEEWTSLLEDLRRAYGLHCGLLALNSEKASLPDSAYASAAQRPPPKQANFAAHWHSLPTSPVMPSHRQSSSSAEQSGDENDGHHSEAEVLEPGAHLGEEDVRRIKTFLREFAVQSLVPWMEKTVSQTNEQLAASRRGLAGRLFSAGRKYFGSRPASPAPGSAQPTYDPIKGIYPYQTQEAQTRRLADFAFMICDYRLALSMYEIVRKDFISDKAWRYYASATRMAGLTTLLLAMLPGSGPVDTDIYLEQAASVSSATSTQLDDLRAICLYYELYRSVGYWGRAAAGLARTASDIDELPSAIMLEQAAMSLLKLRTPARRRFALLMAIASQRYQRTGSKALARRCGLQAMSLYSKDRGSDWLSARRYMDHTLGRQAYNVGHSEEAVQHFVNLLAKAPLLPGQQDDSDDQGNLDDFQLAWRALAGEADEIATSTSLQLSKPLFDAAETSLSGSEAIAGGMSGNDEIWEQLEKDFLTRGYPFRAETGDIKKRPASLLPDEEATRVIIGSSIQVHLLAKNPLNAPIIISDIELHFAKSDTEIELLQSSKMQNITLQPSSTQAVSITVEAKQEGISALEAVSYRYNNSLLCKESLNKRGRRLYTTKAQLIDPTYGTDTSLAVKVSPPGPMLSADISQLPSQLYAGEVTTRVITLSNSGIRRMRNLRILCSHPQFAASDNTHNEDTDTNAGDENGHFITVSNALLQAQPSLVASSLGPRASIDFTIRLRGDDVGLHTLAWLCVYESADDPSGAPITARLQHTLQVRPSLMVVPRIHQEGTVTTPLLDLAIENDELGDDFEITSISSYGLCWRIVSLHNMESMNIPSGQAIHIPLLALPVSEGVTDVWDCTLGQLASLIDGKELSAGRPGPTRLAKSRISKEAEAMHLSSIANVYQLSATRTRLRLQALQEQLPMLATDVLAMFPLYTPTVVDLVVAWRIPSQDRHGHHHLVDLPLAPPDNVLESLLQKAGLTVGGRMEEGQRERASLIDALSNSELAGDQCPIMVHQTCSDALGVQSGRISTCSILLLNRSSQTVSITLQLLGTSSNRLHLTCPPVRWAGQLVYKKRIAARTSETIAPRFYGEAGTRDAGSWVLGVARGQSRWTVMGTDRLVTASS